jgi:hypothetical protein
MSRVVLYHKPKNVTRKPVTRNTLGNTGTRVIPVPVPVISRARASGYGFSGVRVRVAQKNPRAARADPYMLRIQGGAFDELTCHGAKPWVC